MFHDTSVTWWCRLDLVEVIRGFVRERGGLPLTAAEESELSARLCERVEVEIRMHCDRQAWLVGNAKELGNGRWDCGPDGLPVPSDDDIPF